MAYARENGAREAIFGNVSGNLCEGTGSNIFIIQNDVLMTPPLTSGCLPGVTRALVIDICEEEGINLQQVDTPLSGFEDADSAFLTSTLRGVQPIERVNGKRLKDLGGEIVARLQLAFGSLLKDQLDP